MTALSRRKALGLFAAPLVAGTGSKAFAQAATQISLLLVNDIYKMSDDKGRGGFAKLSAVVKAERARGVPMLFAHAGDTFSPSLMSGFDQGAHIVALTNIAKPDIFVPGNHEFDFGKDVYFKRMGESNFPYFAANMRQADGSPIPGMKDNAITDLGGIKVGMFGVALPNTAEVSDPGDLKFLPVMDTVRAQAKILRDGGADIVVCVAHTDRADDLAIARSRLVDVLLTGHDHDLVVNYDGRTVMVESNEEGNYVTSIDLSVLVRTADGRKTVTWAPSFRIHDSSKVTADPETLALVKKYEADLSTELDVDVATLAGPLDSRSATVRSQEAAIGNLIADSLRAATAADIAITNGGGIRGNKQYAAGHKFTRRDILTELPFGNRTIVASVAGADVKAALENGVSQLEQRGGRFPQISGMTVVVDSKAAVGKRIVSVMVGDKPIEDAKIYKVATNDFMLRGGDGYGMLGKTVKDQNPDLAGKLLANDVMVHARKLASIDAKIEGRITIR